MNPSDGQIISLSSHTIASIGQVMKNKRYDDASPEEFRKLQANLVEIQRIYQGYVKVMTEKWLE